jgi:membrane protease YdiL (CAAX protease family)
MSVSSSQNDPDEEHLPAIAPPPGTFAAEIGVDAVALAPTIVEDIVLQDRPERAWKLWAQIAVVVAITLPYCSVVELLANQVDAWFPYSFAGSWSRLIVLDCFVMFCLLALMRVSGERWSTFGVRRPKWSRDVVSGFLALWCAWTIAGIGDNLLSGFLVDVGIEVHEILVSDYFVEPQRGLAGVAAMLLLAVTTGLTEELAMRGILLTRLQRLQYSNWWSVLISAVYFASIHLRGGVLQMWSAFLVGLVFGVAFIWTKRLWPVVIAHSFFDFVIFLRLLM